MLHLTYGKFLYENHRYESAALVLRQAARLDPSNVQATYYLGLAQTKAGDLGGAQRFFGIACAA
ncbi:MAG: tetratricopeptide repeat protein [Myxococcota bacterium]